MVSLPNGIKSKTDLNKLYADNYGDLTLVLSVENPHLKSFQIEINYEYRDSSKELKNKISDKAIVIIPQVMLKQKRWNVGYNPMYQYTNAWVEFASPDLQGYSPSCLIENFNISKGTSRMDSGGIGKASITFVNEANTGQYSEATIDFSCFEGEMHSRFNISGI